MKKKVVQALYFILGIKYVLLLPLYFKMKKTDEMLEEFQMYTRNNFCSYDGYTSFVWLCRCYPEYLNVLYARNTDFYTKILSIIYKGLKSLYIQVPSDKIGKNLMIWHGFSTIVNAQSIGCNCSIWQQVTVGNKLDNGEAKPIIGNNVKICAGAIVVGNIVIGDNSIIAAGAVVVKDVPANVVVAGVPAKIVKYL